MGRLVAALLVSSPARAKNGLPSTINWVAVPCLRKCGTPFSVCAPAEIVKATPHTSSPNADIAFTFIFIRIDHSCLILRHSMPCRLLFVFTLQMLPEVLTLRPGKGMETLSTALIGAKRNAQHRGLLAKAKTIVGRIPILAAQQLENSVFVNSQFDARELPVLPLAVNESRGNLAGSVHDMLGLLLLLGAGRGRSRRCRDIRPPETDSPQVGPPELETTGV